MDNIAIFGAGAQGRLAAVISKKDGLNVVCFIDNSPEKQGKRWLGIPIVSLENYSRDYGNVRIIIACLPVYQEQIEEQLKDIGINDYGIFHKERILCRERIVSYAYPTENEDIILYHVLKDVPSNEIRWIDVGSNDPYIGSVTQFFYERGGCGINIDMEKELIDISKEVRSRDNNLWTAVGRNNGTIDYYSQGDYGGLSTAVLQYVESDTPLRRTVAITTLKDICDKYSESQIHFLKIDVEGMERDVLLGMDFKAYRPWILVIESTLPKTDIPDYEKWEEIVTRAGYHFAYSHGVNRYYVANEKADLDERFIPWEEMASEYCILHADLLYAI